MASPILSLLIAVAGISIAAYTARNMARKRADILREVAARRGGSVAGGSRPRLKASVGEVRLEITMWSTKHGRYTEYWAHLPPPGTAWFKVGPSTFGDWVGKLFGAQDIKLGDEGFDNGFVVKARDPGIVRHVWSLGRARHMERKLAGTRIECDGSVLHMVEPRIEDAAQVESGINFLLELADADPYGLAALANLPEAVMGTEGRFPHAVVPGPQSIRIGPREHEDIARTSARTTAVCSPVDQSPAAAALVNALGEGVQIETIDGETRVTWPGIEIDPRRLVAGIELLRVLSSGPTLGVFR